MSDFQSRTVPVFTVTNLPAAAYAGVRSRRVLAFALDFLLVSMLALLLSIVVLFATLGIAFLVLPSLWPLVAFFYNGVSFSGRHMATPGMRLFDLQARTVDGAPPSFLAAAFHGVLLYLSWLFPPVFLASLVTSDKRCMHDIAAGLIVVRRPD